ncbi:MAG: 3-deoxy-D-manno-octulosonate 8-phosphate phosphatase [Sphingobacteriia bacterium 28-36-52]|nr:MAG: 3-deoxy-D-manno-octulosonate 8-phosphate phosphatase [Sphingobacteriia bacterium 28-36-52]
MDFKNIKLLVLDFDGVLTNNYVWITEDGLESVRCNRSDGIGLSRLRSIGIQTYIVSTEKNKVVSTRANKLRTPVLQGVEDKKDAILKLSNELDIPLNNIAFLGNDINDIPAFEVVGLPIGVADSFEEIYSKIVYKTKKNGGEGAVREICDLIYFSNNRI